MANSVLMISHLADDLDFGKAVATHIGVPFKDLTTRDEVRAHLGAQPDSIVLWNAEHSFEYDNIREVIPKYAKARNIFAITNRHLRHYPDLIEFPIFGHHLLRRYDGGGFESYFALIDAVHSGSNLEGVQSYFPPGTQVKKIPIAKAAHKKAAAEAIHNYITQQGVVPRLATVVTQGLEELLTNALFDAPEDDAGHRVRWKLDRAQDFEMKSGETVEIELAATDAYMAACITDHFGTLKRLTMLQSLNKQYATGAEDSSAMESGMGVKGIIESGLSLLYAGTRGKHTKAMLFFQKAASYKEFRQSPQFFSMVFDEFAN